MKNRFTRFSAIKPYFNRITLIWVMFALIQYGLFKVEYMLPNDVLAMDKDVNKRLYPISTNELTLNPNLKQNPGY